MEKRYPEIQTFNVEGANVLPPTVVTAVSSETDAEHAQLFSGLLDENERLRGYVECGLLQVQEKLKTYKGQPFTMQTMAVIKNMVEGWCVPWFCLCS